MIVGGVAFVLGFLLLLAALFVVQILFILSLQRTLERVSLENRAMSPGLVWLQLIPIFGAFWFIYVVVKLRDSLRREFGARGWSTAGDFGFNIGIAYAVLQLVAGGVSVSERLVYMTMVLSLGGLVCWVIYWVKIVSYKTKLGPPRWSPGVYGGAPYPPPYPGVPAPGSPPAERGDAGDPHGSDDPSGDDDPHDGDDPVGGDEPWEGDDEGQVGRPPGAAGPGADSLLCPECGAGVKRYDRFCHVCGQRLTRDQ